VLDAFVWRVEVTAPTWQERDAAVGAVRAAGIAVTDAKFSSASVTFHAGPTSRPALDRCLSTLGPDWTAEAVSVEMTMYHFARLVEQIAPALLDAATAPHDAGQVPGPAPRTTRQRLLIALADAYRDYARIELMLSTELDVKLADIWPPAELDVVWGKVLDRAEAFGWKDRLLCGAWRGNVDNPQLRPLMEVELAACGRCRMTRGDRCPQLDST
jgi:hypothetical protein